MILPGVRARDSRNDDLPSARTRTGVVSTGHGAGPGLWASPTES